MGNSTSRLNLTEAEHELLRFTWMIVANADYNRNPPAPSSSGSDTRSVHSQHCDNDDASSNHSSCSEAGTLQTTGSNAAEPPHVSLADLVTKKVFHVAFYDKFFKLSPESRSLFPENRSKAGEVIRVMLGVITTGKWGADTSIKHLVKVHAHMRLTKRQFEAFAIAFARTMEYKLDKLCTVYVSQLWERACREVAMALYDGLKREGCTGD